VLLCTAEFVVVGALAVVAIALPSIGEDLGFSRSGLQWVISAYVLAFGGFLLPAGRAADLWGRRRVFTCGLALFSVASLACGLSGSAALLVAARAAQGFGAALALLVYGCTREEEEAGLASPSTLGSLGLSAALLRPSSRSRPGLSGL